MLTPTPTLAVVGPFDEDRDFIAPPSPESTHVRARCGRCLGAAGGWGRRLPGGRGRRRPRAGRRGRRGRPARRPLDRGRREVAVDFTQPDAVHGQPASSASSTASTSVVGTTGFDDERLATVRGWLGRPAGRRRARRAQLRHRRGADDAVRRSRRPVLRVGRDHRAAPPGQGRRPVAAPPGVPPSWSRRPGRRPASAPMPDATTTGARRRARCGRSTACPSTRCGCAGWSPTRRCCSAATGETLTIRHDSYDRASFMPGRAARRPAGRGAARASPSAWSTLLGL